LNCSHQIAKATSPLMPPRIRAVCLCGLAWEIPKQAAFHQSLQFSGSVQSSQTKAICTDWTRYWALMDPVFLDLAILCPNTLLIFMQSLFLSYYQSFTFNFLLWHDLCLALFHPSKFVPVNLSPSTIRFLGPHWFSGWLLA
jgi:hypothetical protein